MSPTALRRLTRFEDANTIRAVFGQDFELEALFPLDEVALGFDNQAGIFNGILGAPGTDAFQLLDRRRELLCATMPRPSLAVSIMNPRLIVINGSIASGKSTVARLLAEKLRGMARSAAVLDLDHLYQTFADDPKSNATVWCAARTLAGSLARVLFDDGVAFVVVEGCFWTPAERHDLCSRLNTGTAVTWVTLVVSFAEALRRAQGDPTRGWSKDPAFLGPHLAAFQQVLSSLRATDRIVMTEGASPTQIAEDLAERAVQGTLSPT